MSASNIVRVRRLRNIGEGARLKSADRGACRFDRRTVALTGQESWLLEKEKRLCFESLTTNSNSWSWRLEIKQYWAGNSWRLTTRPPLGMRPAWRRVEVSHSCESKLSHVI